jgi:hypothetical protein
MVFFTSTITELFLDGLVQTYLGGILMMMGSKYLPNRVNG